MSSAADAGMKRSRVSLGALKPLAPLRLAHRARIALALIALTVASAATLVVPIAVRRMIDFGFSDANAGLIRAYFLGHDRRRRGARARFGRAILPGDDAGRGGGRRPSRRSLHPSDPTRPELLRRGEDRRHRFSPFRRHDPAQGDVRLLGVAGVAQSFSVRRRDHDDGGRPAQNFRPSCWPPYPSSSCRSMRRAARCGCVPAAPRTGSRMRPPSLPRASSAVRVMQSFLAERFTAQPLSRRRLRRL